MFTTKAFSSTTNTFVLGNAQRNYSALRGPGSYEEDVKVSKALNLGERVSFVLEMNYFNVLNRVRFESTNNNNNNNTIDNAANFGYLSAGQQNNARQGQLSGRLQF